MNLREAHQMRAQTAERLAEMDRQELTGRVSPRQRAFVQEQRREAETVLAGEADTPEAVRRRQALATAALIHREVCRLASPVRRALQMLDAGGEIDPVAFERDCERLVSGVRRLHVTRTTANVVGVRS